MIGCVKIKSSLALGFAICFQLCCILTSCDFADILLQPAKSADTGAPWAYEGVDELIPGDILVKPNINLFPNTAFVARGWRFGHAAIVSAGAKHSNPDSLLAACRIIESDPLNANPLLQVREVSGLVKNAETFGHYNSFGPHFTGNRYLLRLNIPEAQKDSIIAFLRTQLDKESSWNAIKSFPQSTNTAEDSLRRNWADNSHWYCSLLVWQAVYYVTGIDLDSNGGVYVYPNDLIRSPYFDNTADFKARSRF
jgi:hypothetical protein